MKEFLVAIFSDEGHAETALSALRELHTEGVVELRSVGIAAKDADGNLTFKDTVGAGAPNAVAGAAIGGLIGLLGGPVGALAGAAGGAFIGTWRDMARLGMGAELVEQITSALEPGKSAVIAEVAENADLVESRMREARAEVLRERSEVIADAHAARDAERAAAAERGETLPEDEERPQLVKDRPMKSAHP